VSVGGTDRGGQRLAGLGPLHTRVEEEQFDAQTRAVELLHGVGVRRAAQTGDHGDPQRHRGEVGAGVAVQQTVRVERVQDLFAHRLEHTEGEPWVDGRHPQLQAAARRVGADPAPYAYADAVVH